MCDITHTSMFRINGYNWTHNPPTLSIAIRKRAQFSLLLGQTYELGSEISGSWIGSVILEMWIERMNSQTWGLGISEISRISRVLAIIDVEVADDLMDFNIYDACNFNLQ